MKRNNSQVIILVVGLALFAAGLILVRTGSTDSTFQRALPYVCIGLGCGLFGQGTGGLIGNRILKNNPAAKKQKEIEEHDERNQEIANRAKAKAYDMMVPVFGALMLSFALMGVDLVAVLLLVFAYLFVVGWGIYYRIKIQKEI